MDQIDTTLSSMDMVQQQKVKPIIERLYDEIGKVWTHSKTPEEMNCGIVEAFDRAQKELEKI